MSEPAFVNLPDPDHPGWMTWELSDTSRFNGQVMGKLLVRKDGPLQSTLRMFPEHRHTNLMDNLHGGTIMSLIDISIFAGAHMCGVISAGTAVTLDLSVQFIGAAKPGLPCDAQVEMLKETRRLVFLRGLVVQGEERVAAFSGTIRKPSVA